LVFSYCREQEHDIFAQYRLVKWILILAQRPMATSLSLRGIGTLNHARNDLDALWLNTEIKGFHDWRKNQLEWELSTPVNRFAIESWNGNNWFCRFSINPPIVNLPKNDQPYSPYALLPYLSVPLTIQSIDSPVMDSGVE
jgi:hypothetical protein